jgi:hypothetical protein
MPNFSALEQQIEEAMERLGGRVMPKLNWSSPRVRHSSYSLRGCR